MKTPTERAAEAIAVEPDPTDRDGIARAGHRCRTLAAHTRNQIAALADLCQNPAKYKDHLAQIREAVDRLEKLMDRIAELDAMAKAALQAQVDADPDMAGGVVGDDGRITFPADQVPVPGAYWDPTTGRVVLVDVDTDNPDADEPAIVARKGLQPLYRHGQA